MDSKLRSHFSKSLSTLNRNGINLWKNKVSIIDSSSTKFIVIYKASYMQIYRVTTTNLDTKVDLATHCHGGLKLKQGNEAVLHKY